MSTHRQNLIAAILGLVILLSLLIQPVFATITVRVGAYEFPPYIQFQADNATGLIVDLITQLNLLQQDYHFELVMTTAVRRHQDFQQGLFDALFFEDANWGWQQRDISLLQSAAFASDEEVFIALRSKVTSQQWFDDLTDKTIAGILGYHYPTADFQTDPELLTNRHSIIQVNDHHASIELVLKQRTDTAIVTRWFLAQYLLLHPQYRNTLLISDRIEQRYQLQLLLHPEHPLDINILYRWVLQLLQQADFQSAFARHGLQLLVPAGTQ